MISRNSDLVRRLVDVCETNFGAPNGTGQYFWGNVVCSVLETLATVPVELPSADEIAQAWNANGPDSPQLNVLNLLHTRLAPLLAARTATTADQPSVSIEDFAEALDLAATALPYDKRRKYNFDERFAKLVAKLELLRPGMVVGASVVEQAIGGAGVVKDAVETPKLATLMDRFHEATGTKDSTDERIMSLGDLRELIRLLDT